MIWLLSIYTIVCVIGLILIYHQIKLSHKTTPDEFNEYLAVLTELIRTELAMFDTSIFSMKSTINNRNYDNFYKDLTTRIVRNIPDSLLEQMKGYYTEEAIMKFISRVVQNYLQSKVQENS